MHKNEEYLLEVAENDIDRMLEFDNITRAEDGKLSFKGDADSVSQMLAYIAENKIALRKFEQLEPTLESLFLEVVGK